MKFFLALALIVAPEVMAQQQMCPGSGRQMCRMMCRTPNCPAGQCAMRQGNCCDISCRALHTKGGVTGGKPGGSSGSEKVNCCGGGAACGYVHCPAIAADKRGCVRPWMMPKKSNGEKMTLDDCKTTSSDGGEDNDGSNNDGASNSHGDSDRRGQGSKCVHGFSEQGISMPCSRGLKCVAPATQMCAGTCYGTCQKPGGH